MEIGIGIEALQQQSKQIPEAIKVRAVRNLVEKGLTKPVKLKNMVVNTNSGEVGRPDNITTQSSFMQVCDHLEVRYVKGEEYKGMEIVDEAVAKDDPDNLFAPKAGDKITVIKVREGKTCLLPTW